MKADITVFDPETIIDRATYDAPAQMAEGIVHVFVNGALAWTQNAPTPARSGRFLCRANGQGATHASHG
jgi:N-acyl-D-amino-acid deacylase